MRTRYSPTREKPTPIRERPAVSVCVVTHYEPIDWYVEIPQITYLSLTTLKAGARDYELIIWDNGSPPEFVTALESFKPDVLIKSYNIGNWNARRAMLNIARAPVVSLADCDLLYSPDWLEAQLKILHTYPNVGMVHGCPSRLTERDSNTERWALLHGGYLSPVPVDWERDFAVSRSMPPDTRLGMGMKIYYKGVGAWVCSLDMQFMAHKEVALRFYDHDSENLFDKSGLVSRLTGAGLYSFSTEKRTAIHLGNRLADVPRSLD